MESPKRLKSNQIKGLWRAYQHEENLKNLPAETHRVTGWAELVKHTGYNRELLGRWIKMQGFPPPEFHYRQKTDITKRRENVWRRVAMWDKRKVGDWFKGREL